METLTVTDMLGKVVLTMLPMQNHCIVQLNNPGMYLVTVRRPGYADWVKASVVVRSGPCHVEGVVLTARLVPPA